MVVAAKRAWPPRSITQRDLDGHALFHHRPQPKHWREEMEFYICVEYEGTWHRYEEKNYPSRQDAELVIASLLSTHAGLNFAVLGVIH